MPPRHRFGRVVVCPAERSLLIDGAPAAVGARAFDLLLALIEHRDRLVSKDELLDRVWPGLVVEENNLQTQVSNLRKLLGASAIVTIPGRGYRFVLPEDAATPPATPAPAAHRLLAALPHANPLLGRADDLADLRLLLRQHRIVTLLGAGGIGKTALALAAAHAMASDGEAAWSDGVAWVELAPITDAALVPSAAAQAIRLQLGASDDALAALIHGLAPLQLLLVLDNAEHQIDAVAGLAQAVSAGAPGVRLLVTSQAPLHVDGERVFRLAALEVPAADVSAEQAAACGAVALFVDQAQAADRHFKLSDANAPTVIALCRQLDGLALAIKLAAARLPLLGLEGLAARLAERLQLLGGSTRGTPTRQQTLRAALDWSHGLLSPSEQAVFRRLAIFVGGFSLELACEVVSDERGDEPGQAGIDHWAVVDILGALVERSLVAVGGTAPQRYHLPEIARDYAALKLAEAGERDELRQRQAQALGRLFDQSYEAYWQTPDAPWLAACAPELDNVRAALDWSARHDPALARRLAGAASFLFLLLGLAAEGRGRWLALQAGADAAGDGDVATARFWLEGSRLHWRVSDHLMREFADRAARQYRARGDQRGVYLALRCAAGSAETPSADAMQMLAEMARLEQPAWPPRLRAQRLLAEADVCKADGRVVELRSVLERLLAVSGPAGLDTAAAFALSGLADVNLSLGHTAEAIRRARELLAARGNLLGNYGLPVLATLGSALLVEGDIAAAREAINDFIELSRSRGWEWFHLYADLFALLAAGEGRHHAAAQLIGHADAVQERLGARAFNAAGSRQRAEAMVAAHLDPETIARLGQEGRALAEAEVCTIALAAH